jgi:hypothetical protein
MKKLITLIGLLTLLSNFTQAQTNATVASPTPPPSFWNGLKEAGQAAATWFQSDTNAHTATNWIGIAYGSYDLTAKKIGYGVAAIYPVNSLLYVGVRVENLNGTWTTPSLQVQVKKSVHILLDETLFGVGGTAIVNGNVAAYTGAGVYVHIFDPVIMGKPRPFGLVGDYETWGGLPADCGQHRVNGGISLGW